jgi:hypothetical protein
VEPDVTELEGLATLFVRLGGGYFLVQAILQVAWSIAWLFAENPYRTVPGLADTLSGATIYLLLGLCLIFLSRRIARVLVKGLD